MEKAISVFDTTLRDGTQGEGISLTVDDKLKIACKLDQLGIQYIEGGSPGSNSKDIEFFQRVKKLGLKAKITAFGSTRRKHSLADRDMNLIRIVETGASVATIVGKSWDYHVYKALDTTLDENLAMIFDSISFIKQQGLEVIFDAEHFFDGFKHNAEYALAVIKHARKAGADWLVMCDTNGGTMPEEIAGIIRNVCTEVNAPLGIHSHNDCELAVANTLAAVSAGVTQVQGTMNGYGERCGNANLCSILPNLETKLGYKSIGSDKLRLLTPTARYISEIANVAMTVGQPFVGNAAFAHKGGIHVSAIMKDPKTYEHIDPQLVGNKQRILVSELAGQSNVVSKAKALGLYLDNKIENIKATIEQIKHLEHQGYQYDSAEASLELLLREGFEGLEEVFTVDSFKILHEKTAQGLTTEAMIKLYIDGEYIYSVAEGNGPVNALDNALRKALLPFYPMLDNVHLTDYKVRVLDYNGATAAKVRVLMESSDFSKSWSTVGVSSNVIEASWEALLDSIRFAILRMKGLKNVARRGGNRTPKGVVNH